ncbi:MAG TPA: gamma-glutamyl-gamma-aminobutyrate hydrolase family protein [Bryobacteraceae bacterium]|nr:gamma-glutamyl-gamma-aminobutyrate hydrolase family protein [Bryobacteraceae bacterium]
MRVVAFRHVPFEGLGLIQPVLEDNGISVEFPDLFRDGATVPDVSTAAGLIFMGGPMSANDELPYLRHELAIIRQAVERAQPVLGVCLGSQLLAKALGAKVYKNSTKEIGWFDVHLTEAGCEDPVLSGLEGTQTVFHWHGETFDLPGGASWLAYSERCRHQAFRIGSHTYGLQFHLEVTPEMIADWCVQDANCGDIRELTSPVDPYFNATRLAGLAKLVFRRWRSLLK